MAFKTDGLGKAYAGAQQESANVHAFATNRRANLIAVNQTGDAIEAIMTRMRDAVILWDGASGLPGMVQWARDQEDDQSYDVVAEFLAMRTAAVAVSQWVKDNFPTGAGGYIEKEFYQANFTIESRNFTPAQTVDLQDLLQVLIDAITVP